MSLRAVHVVGAGVAGLAASLILAGRGIRTVLHEAAPQPGGRCRSYFDQTLGCRIDNGNHLLIAGNRAAMQFLDLTGARNTLTGPEAAVYPFLDRETGERWRLRPNDGRLPWWLFSADRRVPGTKVHDYLSALRLLRATPDQTVAGVIDAQATVFRRLWQPLAVAALNTEVEAGSAALFGHVLRESLGAGGAACRPLVPREGLSETLIEPAAAALTAQGGELRLGSRLRAIGIGGGRVERLDFDGGAESLAEDEAVVLAVPAPVAVRLVPDLVGPNDFRAIVNAHYRVALPAAAPLFVGLVGGVAEWVFRKREVASVTVSAADRLIERSVEDLAEVLWRDVAAAYGMAATPVPPCRIVKERRATFAATPAQLRRRPPATTKWTNLVLAGDWVDTGLPATIEGAIRSGFVAAEALLAEKKNA